MRLQSIFYEHLIYFNLFIEIFFFNFYTYIVGTIPLNNIFESENKQRKNIVVITCEFKKPIPARPSLGPILPYSGFFEFSPLP